jgi:hypothetical protein|tara:strand:- start:684 stop:914 length:231 start_codon:yes stop_codon:yes gene_type:complete
MNAIDRNMKHETLLDVLAMGKDESVRVACTNSLNGEVGHLYKFANRMTWRLDLAMQRITDMQTDIDRLQALVGENV